MELTAQKEKATGEKGPATALELGTYALSRSFSHASHGDRSRSFVPHRCYVLDYFLCVSFGYIHINIYVYKL